MKKSITLKQLAKILGVSVSTVSKALNDSYEISETTKKRVEEAAKLYNYKPNRAALSLKSGKANTIGVILPSIKNFFLARVLRGIENVIANTDYNIIISVTNESLDKEVKAIETLNGLVDGIIIAVSKETQMQQDFNHLNDIIKDMPLVMFDREVPSINCDKVLVDDYESVLRAVKNLRVKGKVKIALCSTINNLSVGELRSKGYVKGIEGLHEPIIIEGLEEEVENNLQKLLKSENIDAIVALDEEATLASFRVANEDGLLKEGKIALIGYAGRTISEHLSPSLTTIDQHGKKVGRTAAKVLLKKFKRPNKEQETIIVDATLRERETTTQSVIDHL